VGWFQVAMEHAAFVRGGQSRADFARELDGLVLRQTADAQQQRRQVLAIEILHGDEMQTFDGADVVHPADVGMRYLSRDPDFVPKSSQGSLAHMRACEKLERHLLAEDQIMRTIHFAHAAFADEAHHTIAAGENRTGWKAAFS